MLDEAIRIFRLLWSGGFHSWRGDHFVVDHAQLFDLPDTAPPIVVGVSGPASVQLAIERGDGIMTTEPSAELVDGFRAGHADGPCYAEAVLAYGPSVEAALETAHRQFRFSALGWAVNSELPTVEGFEAATRFVTPADMAGLVAAGPDVEAHLALIGRYADAGYDHLVLTCPGPDQAGFIRFFETELKPRLAA